MQLAYSPITGPTQPGKNLALGRGLPPAETPPMDIPSGVQRVINAVRSSLPFIQRILPLLDGNVGTVVSNFMTPAPHRPAPPPPSSTPKSKDRSLGTPGLKRTPGAPFPTPATKTCRRGPRFAQDLSLIHI